MGPRSLCLCSCCTCHTRLIVEMTLIRANTSEDIISPAIASVRWAQTNTQRVGVCVCERVFVLLDMSLRGHFGQSSLFPVKYRRYICVRLRLSKNRVQSLRARKNLKSTWVLTGLWFLKITCAKRNKDLPARLQLSSINDTDTTIWVSFTSSWSWKT